MAQIDQLHAKEFLIVVNAFWQFYKKHQFNYPKQFKNYLSPSKWFNNLHFNEMTDTWILIDYSSQPSYKQLKIEQNEPNTSKK